MNTVEELRELRKETNHPDVDLVALEKRLIHAIKEVFDKHFSYLKGRKSSSSASGSSDSKSLSSASGNGISDSKATEEEQPLENESIQSFVEKGELPTLNSKSPLILLSKADREAVDIGSSSGSPDEGLASRVEIALSPSTGVESSAQSKIERGANNVPQIDDRTHKEMDGEEGYRSKEDSSSDSSHEQRPSTAIFSIMISPRKVDVGIERDTKLEKEGGGLSKIKDNQVDFELKEELKKDGSNAMVGLRWNREELEKRFEKRVSMAAREMQSPKVVWVLGLVQKQEWEPIFLLVRGSGKFGFDLEPNPKTLGPPPWPNYESDSLQNFKIGDHLFGLFLLQKENGPDFLTHKHGPEEETIEAAHWNESAFTFHRLQPRDSLMSIFTVKQRRDKLSGFRPAPPAKSPPHPPDLPLNSSSLSLSPTASDFLSVPHPISIRINDKRDVAAADPGDLRLHRFLSLALLFHSIHSLEDKASSKGSARVVVLTRRSHIEDNSFVQPPSVKPPPQPPPNPVSMLFDLINTNSTEFMIIQLSGKKEASGIDPGNKAPRFIILDVLANVINTPNREGEAGCYWAYGCIFRLGTNSRLNHPGKIIKLIQKSIMTRVKRVLISPIFQPAKANGGVQSLIGSKCMASTTMAVVLTTLQDEALLLPRVPLQSGEMAMVVFWVGKTGAVKWLSNGVTLNTNNLEIQDYVSLLQLLNKPPEPDSFLNEFNLEDKVVLKRGGIVKKQNSLFEKAKEAMHR